MKHLNFIWVCFFLMFSSVCYSWDSNTLEGKCPYGCCQRYRDYEIYNIQRILKKCLVEIALNKSFIEKYVMHSEVSSSYDEVFYLLSKKENDLFIHVEIDDKDDIGDYNPFKYIEWQSPFDVELCRSDEERGIEIGQEYAIENHPHFIEFFSIFKDGIIQITEDRLCALELSLNNNKNKFQRCLDDKDYAYSIWYKEICADVPKLDGHPILVIGFVKKRLKNIF